MNLRDFAEKHSLQGYVDGSQMVWSADPQAVPVNAPPGQPWQSNPASFAAPMPVPEPMVETGPGLDWVSYPRVLGRIGAGSAGLTSETGQLGHADSQCDGRQRRDPMDELLQQRTYLDTLTVFLVPEDGCVGCFFFMRESDGQEDRGIIHIVFGENAIMARVVYSRSPVSSVRYVGKSIMVGPTGSGAWRPSGVAGLCGIKMRCTPDIRKF